MIYRKLFIFEAWGTAQKNALFWPCIFYPRWTAIAIFDHSRSLKFYTHHENFLSKCRFYLYLRCFKKFRNYSVFGFMPFINILSRIAYEPFYIFTIWLFHIEKRQKSYQNHYTGLQKNFPRINFQYPVSFSPSEFEYESHFFPSRLDFPKNYDKGLKINKIGCF